MNSRKKDFQKWHVLIASFISYTFDAMGMAYLSLAMLDIVGEWNISLGKAGLLGSAILLGMGLSSFIVGYISDNYGRKKALIGCLAIFGVFAGLVIFVTSWWQFMFCNFISGIGLGGIWGVVASFVNETWPKDKRGKAISFVMSAGQIGFIISTSLAFFYLNTLGWRFLYFTSFFSVFAILYILVFVKESEKWKANREHHGNDSGNRISVKMIFENGLSKQTILATLMAAFTFTGLWGLNTWMPSYLVQERGFNNTEKTIFLIVCYIALFFGQQVCGFLSDKIGRKKTMYLLFFTTTVSIIAFVLLSSKILVFITGTFSYFTTSYAGIFGVYFTELYPTRIRNIGSGFCFNIGRGISAISPFMLGQIAAYYNLSVSIITCAFFFLAAAVLLRFLPETNIK